jgi:hypothetical protein
MGLIRGGAFVIVSVILFLSLLVGGIFLTLSMSLDYEVVKVDLGVTINELVQNQFDLSSSIRGKLPLMEIYCQNNSEYVFNEEGYTFTIPCEVVANGTEAIVEQGVADLIEDAYYAEYDCGFWDCFEKTDKPFFFVSEHAKDYWKSKFNWSLLIMLVCFGLMLLVAEVRSNAFIVAGGVGIVGAFILKWSSGFLLKFALSPIVNALGAEISLDAFNFLLVKLGFVFLLLLIMGIILIAFGIGFRVWLYFSGRSTKVSKADVGEIVEKKVNEAAGKSEKK